MQRQRLNSTNMHKTHTARQASLTVLLIGHVKHENRLPAANQSTVADPLEVLTL